MGAISAVLLNSSMWRGPEIADADCADPLAPVQLFEGLPGACVGLLPVVAEGDGGWASGSGTGQVIRPQFLQGRLKGGKGFSRSHARCSSALR